LSLDALIRFARKHPVHMIVEGKHPTAKTPIFYLVVEDYSRKLIDALGAFERYKPDFPEIQVLPFLTYVFSNTPRGKEVWKSA
jgi:hypothetical protein